MLTHPENLISFWKHYVKKLNFNPVPLKKQENKINTFLRDFEGKSRLTFTSTRNLKYVVVIKNHSASVYTFSALLMASGVLRLIEDEANVANYYSLPTNFMYPTLDCQKISNENKTCICTSTATSPSSRIESIAVKRDQ